MTIAPVPSYESKRIESLKQYNILDSSPEKEYDSIVKIGARICDVPIMFISLIDSDRQWFKARIGLDLAETSRDLAFCAHAILHPTEMLIVRDATKDVRFADNPLVTDEPRIRFYAGQPIMSHDGLPMGTVCAIDRVPRTLNPEQLEAIKHLANHVESLLELRYHSQSQSEIIEQLCNANSSLEQFVYVLSHDLKEPIRRMKLYTDVLSEDFDEALSEKAKTYIDKIQGSAQRMDTIIRSLLAYMKLGSEEKSSEPIEWGSIFETIRAHLDTSIANSSSEIYIDRLPDLFCAPASIITIFQNLISNAIKYCPPERTPQISISCTEKLGFYIFCVADNGEGIPENCAWDIFLPFKRLHSQSHSEGTGLGLAFCKTIIESYGGRIWTQPNGDCGTKFCFKLNKDVVGKPAKHAA